MHNPQRLAPNNTQVASTHFPPTPSVNPLASLALPGPAPGSESPPLIPLPHASIYSAHPSNHGRPTSPSPPSPLSPPPAPACPFLRCAPVRHTRHRRHSGGLAVRRLPLLCATKGESSGRRGSSGLGSRPVWCLGAAKSVRGGPAKVYMGCCRGEQEGPQEQGSRILGQAQGEGRRDGQGKGKRGSSKSGRKEGRMLL